MKYCLIILIFLYKCSFAQKQFIKVTNSVNGLSSKVLPGNNGGWVIFSVDSLRLCKYNECGFNEWSKKYHTQPSLYGLYDFIRLNNGDYAFMNRITKGPVEITSVTRIDPSGNVIWSKSYGDNTYRHFPYSLVEDDNGNLYIYGNVESLGGFPFYNLLIKLDQAGNQIFTKFYTLGGIWGGAIVTDDNGILMRTGDSFIKTDLNGNVLWSLTVNGNTNNYRAPVEVSDGYIFSGFITATSQITLYKMDKAGNIMGGISRSLSLSGVPPQLIYNPANDHLTGVFRKQSGSDFYTSIIEFDKDLNIIKENSLDNGSYLTGTSFSWLTPFSCLISGTEVSGLTFFARANSNYLTGCDIVLPPAATSAFPSTSIPITVNSLNGTFSTFIETAPEDTFSVAVTTYCIPQKQLDLGADLITCSNAVVELGNIYPDLFDVYSWSTGETSSTITVNTSGTYYLEVKDSCDENRMSDSIKITLLSVPEADAGADVALCENEEALLTAQVCDSCTYLWNTGSTSDTITVADSGLYIVTVTSPNGCTNSDTTHVTISKCECDVYIPSAFSPNSDTKNDVVGVHYYCEFSEFIFKIFNRWGQLVYTTSDPDAKWNGRYNGHEVQEGVFVYYTEYTPVIRGIKDKSVRKSGTIVVIR